METETHCSGQQNPDTIKPEPFMEALQTAARLIMENGGETFRAEETVCRMGQGFGLLEVESFVVPSGLLISYRRGDGQLETSVKRVRRQKTNLTRVDEVNRVSRLAADGRITPEEALARLQEIEKISGPMSGPWSLFAAAVCAGGFALLFLGGPVEALISALIAGFIQILILLLKRFDDHGIAGNILGGLLTVLLPNLVARFLPGLMTEAVIAGSLMPLVPGLAMTNAVQDTLRGDMVSGLSHGAQALLTACLIAGGALLGPAILGLLQGGGL